MARVRILLLACAVLAVFAEARATAEPRVPVANRRILITPAMPDDEREEYVPGAQSVSDKISHRVGGPTGELPCDDLEKIVPERITSNARLFEWKNLTPALQQGLRDASFPPFNVPDKVAFALSYFQSCTAQKSGGGGGASESAALPGPDTGTYGRPQPKPAGDRGAEPKEAAAPAADAPPIMDPASVPKELVFLQKPKKKRVIHISGLDSNFLP